MAGWTEAIRSVLIAHERIEVATKEPAKVQHAMTSLEERLRACEQRITFLEGAYAGIRASVSSEVEKATAELRHQVDKQQPGRTQHALPTPKRRKKS